MVPNGTIFSHVSQMIFMDNQDINFYASVFCSIVTRFLLSILTSTRKYEVGLIKILPYCINVNKEHKIKLTTQTNNIFIKTLDNISQQNELTRFFSCLNTENIQLIYDLDEIDRFALEMFKIDKNDYDTVYQSVLDFEQLSEQYFEYEEVKNDYKRKSENRFQNITMYIIGVAFGRWDIRIALDKSLIPQLPDPFDPLPVCSPGMLLSPDGYPAVSGQIVSEEWLRSRKNALDVPLNIPEPVIADKDYPIAIRWDGILVDDEGHEADIVKHLRSVLSINYGETADEREQEILGTLSIKYLRDYFRQSKGFFQFHITRYSKSRRSAPIYWQLSTPSSSYSVWLYYHRFTRDTFYKVLNDYVGPKLLHEERKLTSLHQDYGPNPTAGQRKEIAAQENFVEELRAFKQEVARVAPLWNPNFNDGVVINFAPLWRLVPQLKSWQKECKSVWDKLAKGDYDWSRLAMHLWPERVVPKCLKDRSLAIAHKLEESLWYEAEDGKWRCREVSKSEIDNLIKERTSPSVKAALNELLSAPVSSSRSRKERRK